MTSLTPSTTTSTTTTTITTNPQSSPPLLFHRHRLYLLLLFVVIHFRVAVSQNNIVARSRLFVDGLEFIVMGVDYNPMPLGQATVDPVYGTGGTGFCSQRLTPWKQWKSACYDGDYFDGTPWSIDNTVNGFEPIWQRDFPMMVAAGVNTIRLYNCSPNTLAATQTYTNLFQIAAGKNHSLFMETAALYGLKVIFPLYFSDEDFATLSPAIYKRFLRWQIDEVGNSTSLLMWQFGDEQAWTWVPAEMTNDTVITQYNDYVDYIKQYTYSKWGRIVPITMSMQWGQEWFGLLISELHIDIFSANIFTTSLYPLLFDGDVSFEGFTTATCKYNKPFLITEFGATYLPGLPYAQHSINQIWSQVIKNIDNGLIGAIYFEQTDEPPMNHYFGLVNVSVAYNPHNSGSSTRVNSLITDAVAHKQQFRDLQSGLYNNVAYNFKTSPFNLLGRGQDSLTSGDDRCVAFGTFYDCPTNNVHRTCSGNGMCNRMNGTCSCGTGWTGHNCATPLCPGKPACSLNGVCSTYVSPPECVCSSGYYGEACELMFEAGSCPFSCNGNGICGNLGGCTCFPGWIGADCSITDVKGSLFPTTFGALTSSASVAASSSSSITKSSSTSVLASTVAVSSSSSSSAKASKASTTSNVVVSTSSSFSTSVTALEASSTGAISSSTSLESTSSASSASTAEAASSSSISASSTTSASVSNHKASTISKSVSTISSYTTSESAKVSSASAAALTAAASHKITSTTAARATSSLSTISKASSSSSSSSTVAATKAESTNSAATTSSTGSVEDSSKESHANSVAISIGSVVVVVLLQAFM